jgi:RNA-directed DNA polymerase
LLIVNYQLLWAGVSLQEELWNFRKSGKAMEPAARQGGRPETWRSKLMNITNLFRDCCKYVRKLQIRIAKAVLLNKFDKARKLCSILTNSLYAKILSVWKAINNKGGKTPGVDKVVWDKETDLFEVAITLKRKGYRTKPLRRIYIPKRNGKLRPLGIPVMKDRAMQALHLLALEPIAETLGDPNSYGFRKYRSCRDALNYIHKCLCHKHSATWIYEADIKGCFDNISHEWLLKFIPMDKRILRKWLKCGYIELGKSYPTNAGTPQGGIISPTLMNLTLDGMENIINKHFPKWRLTKDGKSMCVNFIRYADDFIITAASHEIIENEIAPLVEAFLKARGLSLSPEKTKITHIEEGFDFLSQNTRRYPNGKVLQKPSDKAVVEIRHKLRTLVIKNMGAPAHKLITKLNSVLRGWSNYHRHVVSKEIFKEIDFYLWRLLGRWCKRRHPNKMWKWISAKYFSASGELCSFAALALTSKGKKVKVYKLFRAGKVPIIRYSKIISKANPFLRKDEVYFVDRRFKLKKESKRVKQICIFLKKSNEINKALLNLWNMQPAVSETKPLRNARAA